MTALCLIRGGLFENYGNPVSLFIVFVAAERKSDGILIHFERNGYMNEFFEEEYLFIIDKNNTHVVNIDNHPVI